MDIFETKCKIERNDEVGRYVLAAKDIKAGETLLLEEPVLILPSDGERRCSNCFKLAKDYCSTCKIFPLCEHCAHHSDCELLAKMQDGIALSELQRFNEVYGPLKALLLRESEGTRKYFERMLEMEAHLEERRKTAEWSSVEEKAVQPLIKSGVAKYLQDGVDVVVADTIQRIASIADVNCFEIRAPDVGQIRGLFIRGALMSHSCVANTCIAVDSLYQMKVYANCDIAAGQEITVCYTNVLLGTDERRDILRNGKHFHCKCKRCEDPTELGSHLSSFICNPCLSQRRRGAVVQRSPGKWQCIECDHQLAGEHVATVLERAKEEIFHAKDDIYRYEMLAAKLSRILYPSHYLLIDLKQNIAAILRSIIQNLAHRPGRKVYERKVHLCREILSTLNIIQPGISRLKAIAIYELCNSSAELSRMRFQEKDLNALELADHLHESESMLRESVRMLLYEPSNSPEGQLARDMMKELKDLQNDIKLVEKETSEN